MMRTLFLAVAAAMAAPAHGAEDSALLSLVAGYKAAFVCSALFNAGRTPQEIEANELHRIYPDYRAALAQLPAPQIDEAAKIVRVTYSQTMPPRIAVWRGAQYGCTQAPAGGDATSIPSATKLPRGKLPSDDDPWPKGDRVDAPIFAETPDGADLARVLGFAFDRATYGAGTETTAALIVRNGAIIGERYREDFDWKTPQRTWSVAKSLSASVIGAAVQKGLIDADDPAALKAWSSPGDPRAAITVDDLLRMASGLDSGAAGNRTDAVYFGGGRVIDHAAPNRLVAVPGTRFVYANNDTMLAMRALRERMKSDGAYLRFPFEALLFPLGMRRTTLETDWNNDFILSSQVWTTSRDLARLGLLYLKDGVWNGRRILPERWIDYVRAPAGPQPPSRGGYGAQFWLLGPDQGLPEGTFAAIGNRGQFLVIVPARNTLIVRRGYDEVGGVSFDMARFAADVIAALPSGE
jgi:CubicO group peptidase (beta-lactamase class C family)